MKKILEFTTAAFSFSEKEIKERLIEGDWKNRTEKEYQEWCDTAEVEEIGLWVVDTLLEEESMRDFIREFGYDPDDEFVETKYEEDEWWPGPI